MKAPCEKLIELLFTRHALNICGAQTTLYAPSSREEYYEGYDTKLIGGAGFRELYLQFKTPNVTQKGFTVRINNVQHSRLLRYPRGSSFYISHSFQSVREIQDFQLQVSHPRDFLKYFIAVEAHALSPTANFFQFSRNTNYFPLYPKFKNSGDGKMRTAINDIHSAHWCSGISLLQQFKKNKIGYEFLTDINQLITDSVADTPEAYVRFWEMLTNSTGSKSEPPTNYGVMLRNYA